MTADTTEELLSLLQADVEAAEAGAIMHTDIVRLLGEIEAREPRENSAIRRRAENLRRRYRRIS